MNILKTIEFYNLKYKLYCDWLNFLRSQRSVVEMVTSTVVLFRTWTSKKAIRVKWGCSDLTVLMHLWEETLGSSPAQTRKKRSHKHRARRLQSTRLEERPQKEASLASNLILDILALRIVKINFYCLSYPICSILLWQLQQTSVVC